VTCSIPGIGPLTRQRPLGSGCPSRIVGDCCLNSHHLGDLRQIVGCPLLVGSILTAVLQGLVETGPAGDGPDAYIQPLTSTSGCS